MDLQADIEKVLQVTNWSANKNSDEVKLLKSVYYKAFGKRLEITCGKCIQKAYYEIKELNENKPILKQKTMGKFQLKKDKMIVLHGLSTGVTSGNLTDEKAIEILKKHPGHIKSFEKYPANWQEIVAGKATDEESNESESEENMSAESQEGPENESSENTKEEVVKKPAKKGGKKK